MAQADRGSARSFVRTLVLSAGIMLATAAVLHSMGRPWWCECGEPDLASWHVWSRHNSQHVIDPYTFTHVLHGLIFYGLGYLLLRSRSLGVRVVFALALEAGWEILENTNMVIGRYREATISLDYFGDSVINSIADVLACGMGFGLAALIPVRASLIGLIATELVLLLWIRDNLTLSTLMLIYPIQAIKNWQLGGS